MCRRYYYVMFLLIILFIMVGCQNKEETDVIKPTEIETKIQVTETTCQEITIPHTTEEILVWISKTGKRYHSTPDCSDMKKPLQVTLEEAETRDYTPCLRCYW